jgi:hypothetical protein
VRIYHQHKSSKLFSRPHQYYDGSRPSIIYVDEPVHVDAKKKKGSKKSFLALAVLQILLGLVAIISQVKKTFSRQVWGSSKANLNLMLLLRFQGCVL